MVTDMASIAGSLCAENTYEVRTARQVRAMANVDEP